MSVLIKGMEMPMCVPVDITIWPDGHYKNSWNEEGAVIHVSPHGDLVDRDALEQDAQTRLLMCNKNDNQFQKPYEVMRAIALAPTIIPAEPAEEADT